MRIVSGTYRGKKLKTPTGYNTRPTSDKARESIFNILSHASWVEYSLNDALVMDAFAGTGALGLEAISRGAKDALFIESDPTAAKICRENINLLNATNVCSVFNYDCARLPKRPLNVEKRNLVFLDPPYSKGLGEKALLSLLNNGWLADDAILVLEAAKAAPENIPHEFTVMDERTYGIAHVTFLKLGTK